MKILAIDYGSRRLGFAVGHLGLKLASPLDTLKRNTLKDDLKRIETLIGEHEIDTVIIGRPLNMDGSESSLSMQVDRFAAFLKKRISLPVSLVDERLTSLEAEHRLRDVPAVMEKKKRAVDAVAAVIILERFFNGACRHEP